MKKLIYLVLFSLFSAGVVLADDKTEQVLEFSDEKACIANAAEMLQKLEDAGWNCASVYVAGVCMTIDKDVLYVYKAQCTGKVFSATGTQTALK